MSDFYIFMYVQHIKPEIHVRPSKWNDIRAFKVYGICLKVKYTTT